MITDSTWFGVCERVVDRRGPRRIVGDRDDLPQAQHLDDRFEVSELLLETVGRTRGFVGSTKAQEIEGDDPLPPSYQVGNQIVPDLQTSSRRFLPSTVNSRSLRACFRARRFGRLRSAGVGGM